MKSSDHPALRGASAGTANLLRPTSTLPNFFLVGAPKAGTTSLYFYLRQHPEIYMSPIKEPHFFAEEMRMENFTEELWESADSKRADVEAFLAGPMSTPVVDGLVTDWAGYQKLFSRVTGEPVIGEASVCYLWSETAPANIARHCPDARILIMLRNPVDRAYSHYLRVLSISDYEMTFRDYVEDALSSSSRKIGRLYPFLELGMYSEQVRRYFDLFSRDRVNVHLYDDYMNDPRAVLRDIFTELDIDSSFTPDLSKRHMQPRVPRVFLAKRNLKRAGIWNTAAAFVPPAIRPILKRIVFRDPKLMTISAEDRARVLDIYRDDIVRLQDLLGRDLSAWLK